MYGGHGYRPFYISEVDRIEAQHTGKLPDSSYSNAEVQAGFKRLSSAYGPILTIINLEEKTNLKEEEILQWPVQKFYFRIEVYAWQAYTMKKYNDIINKPKKK